RGTTARHRRRGSWVDRPSRGLRVRLQERDRRRRMLACERQRQPERRALALRRFHRHLTAVDLRDVPHDRETEPGAARRAAARLVDAIEALEDALEIARRDPDAVVAHADDDAVRDSIRVDLDRAALL